MGEPDIAGRLVVDVGDLLDGFEDGAVVFRDVGDFRHREAGTAAADAAPGGAAFGVAEHHLLAGLGEVAEQCAARDAAAETLHHALDVGCA